MWMVNGECPDMPTSDKPVTARAALRRLMDEGGMEMESLPYAALIPVEEIVVDPSDIECGARRWS